MKNSLGQRVKIKLGMETEAEKKKRVAAQKKKFTKAIKYFEDLHNRPKTEKITEMTIPLDWMKKQVWDVGREYFYKERRNFIVDKENKQILDIICRYFANDPSFEDIVENGQLQKGLLLIGNCGTGKSSIFDIIQEIGKRYKIPQLWFTKVSTLDLTTQFAKESKTSSFKGIESISERYTKGKVYFDDLDSENMVNDFGIKKELMQEILEMRYNRFKSHQTKTFCSTNLAFDELVKKYDNGCRESYKRIESRLVHMFNFIPLESKDRRF